MPGRRSTPVRSIILLQRAVYRSELRIELRADALNCGDDRNAMLLAIRQYSIAVAPDSLCSNGLLASTLAREPLSSGEFKRKHSRHPRTGTQPACRPSGFGFHGGRCRTAPNPKPHQRRSLSHGGIHSTKDERSGREAPDGCNTIQPCATAAGNPTPDTPGLPPAPPKFGVFTPTA